MRTVQERNIAVCIILSLVTCGLYSLYWFVCMTDDTNAAAGESGKLRAGVGQAVTGGVCS